MITLIYQYFVFFVIRYLAIGSPDKAFKIKLWLQEFYNETFLYISRKSVIEIHHKNVCLEIPVGKKVNNNFQRVRMIKSLHYASC